MSRYPFDWRAWWRYHRALGPSGWGEGALRAAIGLANAAAWRLDAPAEAPVDAVIVIGHQRSGTTWLHRMLALHPAAAAMPLHALLFPSDTLQRRFDRRRPRWLDRAQHRAFGPLDDLHRIRLEEPEEDEFLLWSVYRSPMNVLDRPWPAGAAPAIEGDDRALAFYAEALGKHARRTGRRVVGKNPHFTWRAEAVRRAVPGVRLVALWRHPDEAIASRLTLIRAIWRRRGVASELGPHDVERIYASSVRTYLGGLDAADLDLRYDALLADPIAAVERVHAAFGLEPWTDADRARLGAHLRTGRTGPREGLRAFGLDPDRVARDLAPVYARFGFRRGTEP